MGEVINRLLEVTEKGEQYDKLKELANALTSTDPEQRPSAKQAIETIEQISRMPPPEKTSSEHRASFLEFESSLTLHENKNNVSKKTENQSEIKDTILQMLLRINVR